jgi:exosortase D (VPLPA-CTERM-specific)
MATSQLLDHVAHSSVPQRRSSVIVWGALALAIAIGAYIFHGPAGKLLETWLTSPEYSYAPLIPIIALAILWRDLHRNGIELRQGWTGWALALIGLCFALLDQLTPFVFMANLGLYLFILGLFTAVFGEKTALRVWPGLIYLAFALPLPNALREDLTVSLQLISSRLGADFVRAFGVPVLLEGNVIDLGAVQLQVAEACSGLRYLFPLASFGFLCGYLFRGARWERVSIFVMSVPITVIMNSVRIGVTGLLVDQIGLEAAQGFFHDFEGWIVFCGCLGILLVYMKALCLLDGRGRSVLARLDLDFPWRSDAARAINAQMTRLRPALLGLTATAVVFGVLTVLAGGVGGPVIAARTDFDSFPMQVDAWTGSAAKVDPAALESLNVTDYLSLNFLKPTAGDPPINVWIAYYANQQPGNSIHSPQKCIPGGGWAIDSFNTVPIEVQGTEAAANRLIISRGGERQLVYYWFQERNRIETNEYMVKWHTLTDSVTRKRTDGALVRFVVPLQDGEDLAAVESHLRGFIGAFSKRLSPYLPN